VVVEETISKRRLFTNKRQCLTLITPKGYVTTLLRPFSLGSTMVLSLFLANFVIGSIASTINSEVKKATLSSPMPMPKN